MADRIAKRDARNAEFIKNNPIDRVHPKYPNYSASGIWIGPRKTDTEITKEKSIELIKDFAKQNPLESIGPTTMIPEKVTPELIASSDNPYDLLDSQEEI
jgi:hypothetical protein